MDATFADPPRARQPLRGWLRRAVFREAPRLANARRERFRVLPGGPARCASKVKGQKAKVKGVRICRARQNNSKAVSTPLSLFV